ncbi:MULTISPECIES: thioesterase II family protein [Lonsdalea]|nr:MULTISPECIES: alpha/beta fold hydrolase [Lonsdalea]OSM99762.1 hypothetical protein AU499_11650 [Lonsdalea populi]QPQ24876.1 thioesterase [Lonsdalea populi]RAT15845.1 hypothetical protein AU486_09310 [Lonsdalea quercina]RAT38813.1 hypothetical protein AU491_02875 [Lonsdalea populi]RAT53913.1 hypothetical protein AU497_05405 [Lonsdalea populi]
MKKQTFFTSLPTDDNLKPVVFCFPHAGGSSEDYLKWQRHLNSCATLMAVCLPGTGRRFAEEYPSDIDSLSVEIANDIDRSGLHNYYLFGHSMGAILAYEVALKVNSPPKGLIVSSSASPDCVPSAKVVKMNGMSDKAFSEEILFFNGIEEQFFATDNFLKFFLKKIRKDFELIGRYKHKSENKLSVPVYSVVGDQDPHVSKDAMAKWASVTTAGYKNHIVPGNHFYFNENPELITAIIKECIDCEIYDENCGQSLII